MKFLTTKFQPEFYKPWKPQNNAGCCGCGSCKKQEEDDKPTVRRYCYIRYDAGQGPAASR